MYRVMSIRVSGGSQLKQSPAHFGGNNRAPSSLVIEFEFESGSPILCREPARNHCFSRTAIIQTPN